jgi:hypothetical protein
LADLQAALGRDPGDESLIAMAYYNPASGTGTTQEGEYDRGLLGTDLQIAWARGGDPRLGLTDRIVWISAARGAKVADVYPAFKAQGQALMGDSIHPNSRGQVVIAEVFREALAKPPLPPPPDTIRPGLRLSGATTQRVHRRRGVIVKVASPAEASTVTAKGRVTGTGRVRGLTPVTKPIAWGGKATLRLKLDRSAIRAISRALRAGRTPRARIAVTAKDAAGNLTRKELTVRLRW